MYKYKYTDRDVTKVQHTRTVVVQGHEHWSEDTCRRRLGLIRTVLKQDAASQPLWMSLTLCFTAVLEAFARDVA